MVHLIFLQVVDVTPDIDHNGGGAGVPPGAVGGGQMATGGIQQNTVQNNPPRKFKF